MLTKADLDNSFPHFPWQKLKNSFTFLYSQKADIRKIIFGFMINFPVHFDSRTLQFICLWNYKGLFPVNKAMSIFLHFALQ